MLLRLFVDRRLTADEFELVFLRLYKLDPTEWPPDLFDVLDTLFGDVDAYCADDGIRGEVGGIDADQLHQSAATALSRLEKLAG
ncbi:colicin immunity domain-containing protein [Arthrobacter bambusae]|uniref:colicin immunity domain-containing protein n=1 Tax=Arthrobacter bambusae TaxID=1338426 RepID=UPI0027D8E434|nr:colicin immunity domain-containing protein [Arthrobacter bambusae]